MSPELAAITADPSKLDERLRLWNLKTLKDLALAELYGPARPYVLEAADCTGSFEVARFASIEALVAHVKAHGTPKGCCPFVYNADEHDCDGYGTEEQSYSDGLTEDERDAVGEVL
jgi:hypothetical protein